MAKSIEVIAINGGGFIHGRRMVNGDRFTVESEQQLSARWMQRADKKPIEGRTKSAYRTFLESQELRLQREAEEIAKKKAEGERRKAAMGRRRRGEPEPDPVASDVAEDLAGKAEPDGE